jgi:hypothetical protein
MDFRVFRLFFAVLVLGSLTLGVLPAKAQTATPIAGLQFSRELSRASGNTPSTDVRVVQQRLVDLGYGPFDITGVYGPQTELAVSVFQAANSLPATGVVDLPTWTALFKAAPVPATPTVETVRASLPNFPANTADTDRLRLDRFKLREESLNGPFDGRYLTLRLPSNWQLQPGAALELDFDTLFGGTTGVSETSRFLGGTLEVQFNNISIGRIFLDQPGPRLITLPITDTALVTTRPDGAHSLSFNLDAGIICGTERQTSVVIRTSTTLVLPHTIGAPQLNLGSFPRPIYQNTPLQEDAVAIVVPAKPSEAELKAALTVSAKFGALSSNDLQMSIIPEDVLTPTLRNETNLIFVGKAGSFQTLGEIELPAPFDGGSFSSAEAQPGDGVLELAISPWNDINSVLLVTGDDDAAVVKASQALSTGNIRSTANPALSVIAEVHSPLELTGTLQLQQSEIMTDGTQIDRTLADLGYETETAFGIGAQTFDYTIELPQGNELLNDGTFDLLFSHSALLNYSVSGMIVRLNDQPVSSVRFNDQTAQNGTIQVPIPQNTLKGGKNLITLTANLIPDSPCVNPTTAGVWISVRPESLLHFTLRPIRSPTVIIRRLDTYYDQFLTSPTLNNVAFVVPSDDPVSWNTAARIASDLGDRSRGPMVELTAVYPTNAPTVSGTHNLILVGQPVALPLIKELNPALPAPFPDNSNHPTLGNSRVTYRVPQDLSLGYLELARSPWNKDRSVLGVFGSTAEGIGWSGKALDLSRLRNSLLGTVAVINNEQISVEDTTLTNDTSALAERVIIPDAQNPTYRDIPAPEQPTWILGLMGAAGAVMLIILVVIGLRALRNRQKA